MASESIEPGNVAEHALAELVELREAMLDYDATRDRAGATWDSLRVNLDRRLLLIIGLVAALAERERMAVEAEEARARG